MRVSAKSVSVLIALCVPTAWVQTHQTVASPAAPSGPIYITHVTVIDMETGKEFRDRTVRVSPIYRAPAFRVVAHWQSG